MRRIGSFTTRLGEPIEGSDFLEFGGIEEHKYRLCLKVVAMGDTNGVAIAQEVHESILFSSGCLDEKHMIRYDTPIPIFNLYEFCIC